MKKIMMRLTVVCLVFYLFSAIPFSVYAEGEQIYDQAQVISSEELDSLGKELDQLLEKTGWNLALVTTNSSDGKTSRDYADDFYDDLFGINTDGVLYLIDFENRESYISTSGQAINVLTDSRIENMLDAVAPYLGAADYSGAMHQFMAEVSDYNTAGVPTDQYQYDTEKRETSYYYSEYPNSNHETASNPKPTVSNLAGTGLFLGVITAVITIVVIVRRYKFHAIPGAVNYLNRNETVFREKTDSFLRQYTTSVRINTDQDNHHGGGSASTTHTSSGGGTHGGGGRGF